MKKNHKLRALSYDAFKKTFLVMRIVLFISLLCIMQSFALDSYTQSSKISLSVSEMKLEDIIVQIESETMYRFAYNKNEIDVDENYSVDINRADIKEVLNQLFTDKEIDFKILDRQIVLSSTKSTLIFQQQKSISGQVTDADGAALPGVTVVVKGTTQGVITDFDGNYSIQNIPEDAILQFSFVGMKTQEISVGNQSVINIVLQEETIGLDEVVAVGYGVQKRANVVGAVTSISGESIHSIPAANVTNALSGRLPGAVIMQNSGEPGQQSARILVRGRTSLGDNTSPLVVIDGIPGRQLDEVDPMDVESVSVLKDASAAIYGSSAANGVILITTKKGSESKPRLNYQFYQGFMQPTIIPETTDSYEYATMLNEYEVQNGKTRTFSDRDIELYKSGEDPWEHPNSDWYGDLIRDWTTTSRHAISFDGGYKKMTYYVSLGIKNDESIYQQASTKYTQYNVRTKIDLPITDWLKTGFAFAGFQVEKRYPMRGAGDIVGQSTRLLPTQWSFWPNGKPGPDIEYGDNPVVTSTLETGSSETSTYRAQNTFTVSITPPFLKGLAINAFYNYDVDNTFIDRFKKPWILYFPNWEEATRDASTGFITDMPLTPTPRGISSPELENEYRRDIKRTSNVNFTYENTFGDHSISLYGGYEQYWTNYNEFSALRKYYITDVVRTLDAGADLEKTNEGNSSLYARKSVIGRLNYSYKEKYLAEILFRRDGSLKFPKDGRWGNFPGLMLGWRASEEDFWKNNLPFINYFKLRVSYGSLGSDPVSMWQYINKYQLENGLVMGDPKIRETSVVQQGVANPFITWEKQTTRNLGFDSQLLDNKFHLNLDVFYNKRSDILAPRDASVPAFTGIALPDENIAEVDNRGFEVELGYHNTFANELRLDVTGNLNWNHNEVVFMDEPARNVPWQERTGHPYGALLRYNAIGVFADQAAVDAYPHWDGAQPGDVIFEDVSGDGTIDSDDKILLDYSDAPETTFALNLSLSYKNFSLVTLIQGQGKYYRFHTPDDRRGAGGNYFQWNFDNRWTPENTDTNIGRAWDRMNFYWAAGQNNSTYWYFNMAYARLKNVVLTYDIPSRVYQKLGISKASVSLSANNAALLWSAQRHFDPELGDPTRYPLMRTFAVGANITF
ncbi:TonB-dependent receptor [Sunxiuqinia sp. A32]|uniref:TonB-dependent receptor n=1 Tax=Sunxiuqinia sp. A32 TaxID=3461496 RepID=UPI0040462A84